MSVKEVKILLLKKGLNFADMARELETPDGPSRRSLEVMIADLLYERRWYPSLAAEIRAKWGIRVTRAAHLQPIRQQLKQAA